MDKQVQGGFARDIAMDLGTTSAVSYTHLTLPTKLEV